MTNKIKIQDNKITIYKDKLGSYEVKKRNVVIKGSVVEFIPVGTNLIGAWGRKEYRRIS